MQILPGSSYLAKYRSIEVCHHAYFLKDRFIPVDSRKPALAIRNENNNSLNFIKLSRYFFWFMELIHRISFISSNYS